MTGHPLPRPVASHGPHSRHRLQTRSCLRWCHHPDPTVGARKLSPPHRKECRSRGGVASAPPSSSNHHQQERYPALIPAVLTAMHTIELIGSYAARHVESGLMVDLTSRRNCRTIKGPISPLCRKLVELGHDPSGKVHVIRKALDRDGHIPVFQRDRTLKTWAGLDCVESETRSVRTQKYRPRPDAVEASQRG